MFTDDRKAVIPKGWEFKKIPEPFESQYPYLTCYPDSLSCTDYIAIMYVQEVE